MTTAHDNIIDDTWPNTTTNAENIHWERVKTEEEEYLDKLQSKLKCVMSHAVQSNSRSDVKGNTHSPGTNKGDPVIDAEPDGSEEDDDDGNNNNNVASLVDDEGLHLLYDQKSNHNSYADNPGGGGNPIAAKSGSDLSTELVPDDNPTIPIEASADKGNHQQNEEEEEGLQNTSTPTRPRIVRFRSRVRIGSGIRNISTSSSTCGSASSSISVPLRGSRPSETRPNLTGHPTASLTEMLTTDATNAWLSTLATVNRTRRQQPGKSNHENRSGSTPTSTERTALLARVYSYGEPADTDVDTELNQMQSAMRKSEEDVMFGKWPWRLFNRYWWWWRLEPMLCFCGTFDDESESDI